MRSTYAQDGHVIQARGPHMQHLVRELYNHHVYLCQQVDPTYKVTLTLVSLVLIMYSQCSK